MVSKKETDYLIIGAGAMGLAFADVIFSKTNAKITIVDRRDKPGGHWINAYPFVSLHQPAAYYGVNSLKLGNNTADLSSKPELLEYFEKVMTKFIDSGRVEFLGGHNYVGDGKVVDLNNPQNVVTFQINKKMVDATYMNVEVPSTHVPSYQVDEGVSLVPINDLPEVYHNWDNFYVVGCGKTGMDAILFLLKNGISKEQIYWIAPNEAWLFNRANLQVKQATEMVLRHSKALVKAWEVEDIFIENEEKGNIFRLNKSIFPKKWRCATVSPEEFEQLKKIENVIRKGRVSRITNSEIIFQNGKESFSGKSIFIDCSANGLSKRKKTPIFSEAKITLQSVFFCQQVFSAALIARMELVNASDVKKNKIVPVPHPEFKEDWHGALSLSIDNLLIATRYFPLWMFRSRLNFMSHEPIYKYVYYGLMAFKLATPVRKAAKRLDKVHNIQEVAMD